MKQSTAEALWAAPPVTTGGMILCGVTLENWVVVLTAIYTLFLVIDKLPVMLERLGQFYRWLKGLNNE